MVSLPLSFLSLAWASTVDYEVLHSDRHFRVKDKVLIFSTHLFILSIRLFAVALFTVSYKWWVTGVLIFHCTVNSLVPPHWVGCLRCFGLKTGIDFAHFDLESGMIFKGTTGV